MNDERRATKLYIRNLAPVEAIKRIESYLIPSPQKEVLITACIARKEGYAGMDYLEEKYNIHIGYWTFGRRLKEALDMFRKSDSYNNR